MKRARRGWFFGAPLGASLLIAAIPGPCTSFDDVAPPYVPQCGLSLKFPPGENDCQRLVDNAPRCCSAEKDCSENDACTAWVDCVEDSCPAGATDAACAGKCGSVASFTSIVNEFTSCKNNALDADECVFLPRSTGGDDGGGD